jgi:hypothetical protein
MSGIMNMLFSAVPVDSGYYFGTVSNSLNTFGSEGASAIDFGTSGDFYVVGNLPYDGTNTAYNTMFKFNTSMTNQWALKLSGLSASNSSGQVANISVAVDSSNDAYAVFTGTFDVVLYKVSSAGSLVWTTGYGGIGYDYGGGSGSIFIDTNNSTLAAVGHAYSDNGAVTSYALSNGAASLQKEMTSSYQDTPRNVVAVSGNLYLQSDNNGNANISQITNTGTINWQKEASGFGYSSQAGIAVISSLSAVYTLWWGGNPQAVTLIRTDTSGNYVWAKTLNSAPTGNQLTATALTVDSNNFIYAAGTDTSTSGGWVAKYDSNGVLQWQRSLSFPVTSIRVDATNSKMYITGQSGLLYTAILPTDGGRTGTYNPGTGAITYSASSYVAGTYSASFTNAGWSLTTVTYSAGGTTASALTTTTYAKTMA